VQNGTLNQKWIDVDQILVLTHVHQDMFWHWMVSEMYRMLPLYHYMLAHPDIYIHINGGDYFIPKYVEMLGIDRYASPHSTSRPSFVSISRAL
jgi:hypothetical protein